MKRAGAALCIALGCLPGFAAAAQACSAQSGPVTGALLELYTSEGCSSCPPADHWFGQMARSADSRKLSLLAFHVDYWDELGWPDRFAQHAFTVRQGERARAAGSSTIYTPQLMASEHLNLRWNNPAQVNAVLASDAQRPAQVGVRLSATALPGGDWRVIVQATPNTVIARGAGLFLALYEDDVLHAIDAGENSGKKLRHERVVRGLFGPWPLGTGTITRKLDVATHSTHAAPRLGLTAFVQDKASGRTLQALSLPLSGCTGVTSIGKPFNAALPQAVSSASESDKSL